MKSLGNELLFEYSGSTILYANHESQALYSDSVIHYTSTCWHSSNSTFQFMKGTVCFFFLLFLFLSFFLLFFGPLNDSSFDKQFSRWFPFIVLTENESLDNDRAFVYISSQFYPLFIVSLYALFYAVYLYSLSVFQIFLESRNTSYYKIRISSYYRFCCRLFKCWFY